MTLRVTVLGASGSYPGPGAACSGYLVRGEGATVWLDAGSGTLANLQRHVSLSDVDAVVLSHEHPDHWSDVEGYYVAVAYVVEPRDPVPVYAPAGVREATHQDTEPFLTWHTITEGDDVAIGGLRLSFSRTDHGPETLAVRVEDGGRSFGYSADTGPGWSLGALGPGLDLALVDASFLRGDEGRARHLSARQAGLAAKEAGARRLVLTHLWPTVDPEAARAEAEAAFGAPVEVATTDATFEI